MKKLSAILVIATAIGCGPATETETPPRATSPQKGGVDARLANVPDVYEAFGYHGCKSGENCARTFSIRVGLDLGPSGKGPQPNPRSSLSNPDPLWLPEWGRLPAGREGAHYAFEALALAAVHKAYRADCEKAHGAYDKDLTARLDKLEKGIAAANRDPNPYDRLSALLALEPPKPNKARMFSFAEGADAVRYRWETAVFDAFEDTKRTFLYAFDGYAPSDAVIAVIHPRQPKDFEIDAFCLAASRGLIGGMAPLPDTSSWDAEVKSMTRRFVPEERATYVEKRLGELADVTRAKFAKVMVPNPQLPPGVREIAIGKVDAFARDGKKAIVTSLITRENKVSLPDGTTKTVKSDDQATATFEDWPSGVVLEPGDSLSFYGAELSVKELVLKSTKELEHKSRQYVLEGKHVTKLTNKGKTRAYFR